MFLKKNNVILLLDFGCLGVYTSRVHQQSLPEWTASPSGSLLAGSLSRIQCVAYFLISVHLFVHVFTLVLLRLAFVCNLVYL